MFKCSNSSWLLLTNHKVDHHQSIFLIETKNEFAVKMIFLVVEFFVVKISGNLSRGCLKFIRHSVKTSLGSYGSKQPTVLEPLQYKTLFNFTDNRSIKKVLSKQ